MATRKPEIRRGKEINEYSTAPPILLVHDPVEAGAFRHMLV